MSAGPRPQPGAAPPRRRGGAGSDEARIPRKDRTGASPVKVGLVALVVLVVAIWLGFTKELPFTHGFRVRAVFESANSIRLDSPVRIAGVNVGKVTAVDGQPGTDFAVVTMELDDAALPLHKDATAKIRPRIFLEGNFFVDIAPGTPGRPTIEDGDTLPVTQTAIPVQLDQVLSALQAGTRAELRRLLEGLGTALTYKPPAARDRGADPSARGESAAESLNDSIRFGARALRGTAIVADALRGAESRDLSRLIASLDRVSEGLGRNEEQLEDLVSNFNATLAVTASEDAALQASIRALAPALRSADGALDSLNAAFPSTRAFAREILPGVRQTNATIQAGFPWIREARALLGPDELQGLARELSPATRDLAAVIDLGVQLLPQVDLAARCADRVLLPTGDIRIDDPLFGTGAENYKEFWYAMVGLAGEGQNFDANGQYVRFQTGGGASTIALGGPGTGGTLTDRLFGNAAARPLGTRPAFPGAKPPYNPSQPCYTNPLPDVNGAATGPPDSAGTASAAAAGGGGSP